MKNTLYAIGEALIDFIPQQTGCGFSEVSGFSPAIGGAPANVCAAFSRLGGKARLITQLGDDPFGHKIANELEYDGVDVSLVSFTKSACTGLAFVSLEENGNRTFSFCRKPSADMLYTGENLDLSTFSDAYALHFCSVSLGDFPMREAHVRAIDLARRNGAIISFDPNLRPQLWDNESEMTDAVKKFLPLADVLKISDEELRLISGDDDFERALPKLMQGNVKLVLYTCGGNGAYACNGGKIVFSPSVPVHATDTTGAGDGFAGSFLMSLNKDGITPEKLDEIDESTLKQYLDFSCIFCGISVQHHGAIPSYPTYEAMGII